MKTFQNIVLTVFCFMVLSIYGAKAQSDTKINWKEDLEIYKSLLEEKHINLYHTVTKEAFTNEWEEIYGNLNSLENLDVITKLMRLTRRIHDGHTSISLSNVSWHQFPFEIKNIEGKWRVVKTLKAYEHLLYASLESINNIPIQQVAKQISEVAQFVENKYSLKERTGSYLTTAELLFNLNIIDDLQTANFNFLDKNNKKRSLLLHTVEKEYWYKQPNLSEVVLQVSQIKKPIDRRSDLWYAPILETNALYINFKSYPTFEVMQRIGEQLVGYIQENSIKQVIIDMRENGGGDLYVGTVLAYALNLADSIDWEHGVYVLTSNHTFSAATSNAALFKQLLNAKIVGQPTGSNPNGYQDMDTFTLPNSKLVVTYSKRLFRLSEIQNTALKPDVVINQSEADLLLGKDTVLATLINKIKN